MEIIKKLFIIFLGIVLILGVVYIISESYISQEKKTPTKLEEIPDTTISEFAPPDTIREILPRSPIPVQPDTLKWQGLSNGELEPLTGKIPYVNLNSIFTAAAKRILPAVVTIRSEITKSSIPKNEDHHFFWERRDEDDQEPDFFRRGTGSGIIITKEGHIAGPKVLEHIVDTVLQFEGDDQHIYRLIRSVKNRYGSTADLGIFEMTSTGLREVTNPSEILLSNWDEQLSGVAIASTLDGIRPFLIEVQALVSSSVYATPQRSSTGFDLRRLSMLLAVLEKRAGFRLTAKDVFLNIAGGLKIYDPAIDLAVIISILSSNFDLPVDSKTCFAAEVGLSGEIRPVSRIEQRIGEAEKLGFNKIFVSKYMNRKITDLSRFKIGIEFVGKVEDVFKRLFDK